MLLSKYSQERNYWIVISNNSKSSVPYLKKKSSNYVIPFFRTTEQQHLKLFIKLTWIRNAEVVLQRSFWLAYFVYICNTVESNSQLSQIFTLHERSIATAIGKRAWLHALLFTSLYKRINMVGMPGKVNPPELCACTYERVHVYLHMHNCVLIDVCVCRQRQNQSHQFSGVFPASPLLLITIDLGVIVYFLFLSFVCHQLHMVVVCINSYVVHICVRNLSRLISAQSQQKGIFCMLLRATPSLPSRYWVQPLFSHA